MSNEFLPSSPKIDQAVIDATSGPDPSFEHLRESLKAALVTAGRIERTPETLGYGIRLLPGQQAEPNVPLAASQYRYEKEIRFAESTGKRTLIIRANSQADLDSLERQVTGQ